MSNYNRKLFSAVSLGLILSGCSWNQGAIQATPGKTEQADAKNAVPVPVVQDNEEIRLAKALFNHQDCLLAFQIFQKYAAEGDPEAEAWLGRCYLNGVGVTRDEKKAYECFRKAAEKNNPWGINGLGVCTQYGWGTAINLQTAMDLYKKAADMKHPLGTLNLARTYADKEGGFFDAKMAEVYFKKALDMNAPSAKAFFASFLYDAKRYAEAVPLLLQSLDDPQSMWMMAMCYQNGWGVPVNIAKAVELAEKSFQKGGAAEWSAELCFGAGLEESMTNGMTETAKRRLKCAADQGHAEAQYLYARVLAEAKDENGALYYMLQAADKGYSFAILEAGQMLLERAGIMFGKAALIVSAESFVFRCRIGQRGHVAGIVIKDVRADLPDKRMKNAHLDLSLFCLIK